MSKLVLCDLLYTCVVGVCLLLLLLLLLLLDPESGSQKATSVVLVVISSLKIPKAFLISSGAQ